MRVNLGLVLLVVDLDCERNFLKNILRWKRSRIKGDLGGRDGESRV